MKEKIPEFFHNVILWASRPCTPHRDELGYLLSVVNENKDVKVLSVSIGHGGRAYYIDKKDKEHIEKYLTNIIESERLIDKHLREYNILIEKFNKFKEKVKKINNNRKEIFECFNAFLKFFYKLPNYGWMPFVIEEKFLPVFLDKLKNKYEEKADEIYQSLTSGGELYEYQKMRVKICEARLEDGKRRKEIVEELIRNYNWTTEYSMVEKLADEKYFENEIGKLGEKEAKDEMEDIINNTAENKKNYEKAVNAIDDKLMKKQAELINKYVFLRNDRVDYLKKAQVELRKVFEKVAENINERREIKWNYEHIVYFLNKEIEDYLLNDGIPDNKEIEKRMSGNYVYWHDESGSNISTDNDFIAETLRIINKEQKSEEIRGTIAFKGKTSGKARIILSKNDLHNIKKGDVLIARTTMPDYTPAMQIASAIVTDEGGLLSHAAIISREVKKPCIVGCKNATKILKTGDLIEVDADKGIVKILKRNSE